MVRILLKGNVKAHITDWFKSFQSLKNIGQTDGVSKKLTSPNSTEILLPRLQHKNSQSQKIEGIIPRHSPIITYSQPQYQPKPTVNAYLPDITRSIKNLENGLLDVFNNNRQWANAVRLQDAKFFETLAKGQEPKLFWIGCSDSRVPAEIITKLGFGEIFVHRNIANQFKEDDTNCLSELEFAVYNLKVEHIIVCGHTKCGGIQNAYNDLALRENLKIWLSDIRKIKDSYPELFPDQFTESKMSKSEIDFIHKKLVSVNVINQVNKISENIIVKEAWKDEKRRLAVHGWIFNMENGHLEDLYVTRNK
ncbi:carbonate dehydratase [Gigaspora margarita]|uniref:Carbonic anhydrase n=1 Tax=Gigaspora margarita TaxID=4874 RepID=A0A8H4A574_GIGMA|nr:carbonate dehydratase [Gigaspora margarita]